ncbi:hypothetical protein [Cellulomonas sp. S1-8]|uniref:hypothetical protein n=1 Tax=Cellulomonas sp. S1-8 TaxID=2904790 RepID=UPI002243C069|nr:hypothetical protein [Cellulomonas sp. S1-8]UZN02085.1 hypothetical protein OKX07_13440 [Cellulomonas sp. S1-8]
MSTTDEQYAQTLRARVEAVAPSIDVEVDRVVPRARRRRAVARGGLTATSLVLVLGAGWGASSLLGAAPSQVVVPALTATADPAPPRVDETPAPEPTVRPTVPAVAVVADDGTVTGVPGDPWDGDERYWYRLTESRRLASMDGVVTLDEPERMETWSSRERPGLMVWDGDHDGAAAKGPAVVLGSWVVAGQQYEMLADPRVLPTEPDELAQVVRDSLQPDRGSGSDDDKVYEQVRTALSEGGLWGAELRSAFWGVAAALPGVVVVQGQDGAGRTGEVLQYTDSRGVVHQLVREPSTGLLLEESGPQDGSYIRYLEQRPVDAVPLEPTLGLAGCAAWATC